MHARWFAIAAVLALLGCQRSEPPQSQPAAVTAPARAATNANQPIDVHGIAVTFRDDGMVELHGRDRFGGALDSVYENIEFFRNALPVLDRSLTIEQSAGLRALAPPKR